MSAPVTADGRAVSERATRRPQQGRAKAKRKAIVAAAVEVIIDEGPNVTMERIADVAGVSKVTIYNHFNSKDELLVEVVRLKVTSSLAATEQLIDDLLPTSTDLNRDLHAIAAGWVDSLSTDTMLGLRTLVAGEVHRLPELGVVWIECGPGALHGRLGVALKALDAQGTLEIPDLEVAVLQLAGLLVSAHVMYGPYGGAPDDALSARLIDSGIAMFLAHYERRPE